MLAQKNDYLPKAIEVQRSRDKRTVHRSSMGLFIWAILCLSVPIIGCGNKATQEVDPGTVEGWIYRNNYFGLRMPIPTNWYVMSDIALKQIPKRGISAVAGDDRELKRELRASASRTVYLLGTFRHRLTRSRPKGQNAGMLIAAEIVKGRPDITRGSQCLEEAKALLESSPLKASSPEDFWSENIDGLDFDVMGLQAKVGTTIIHQKCYCTILKGYALSIALTFDNQADESMLTDLVREARFSAIEP